MEPPPLTLLVVLPNNILSLSHKLFSISNSVCQCISTWLTSLCHRRARTKVGHFFCIIHLKKGIGNWNKIFFFFSPTDLSACAKTVGNKKKKKRDFVIQNSTAFLSNLRPPRRYLQRRGCTVVFFLPQRKGRSSRSIFEYFVCVCLVPQQQHHLISRVCVCVCVCLLFLHLEIFLFCLILHASDVCKYLKFLSIFFPLLHSSSPDITFLLNRLLIH